MDSKKIELFVLAVLVFLFSAIEAEMRLGLPAGIFFVVLGVAIFLFEVRRPEATNDQTHRSAI